MKDTNQNKKQSGPKKTPYQRFALDEPLGEPILTRETRKDLAKSLNLPESSIDDDPMFYDQIDKEIRRYRKLPERRKDYLAPPIQRSKLESVSKAVATLQIQVDALDLTSRFRFYRALGKRHATVRDGRVRRKKGQARFVRSLKKIEAAISIALSRTKNLPKGNRELENETWLSYQAASLLWEWKKIEFTNSSSNSITTRSDPRPRNFIEQILKIALGRKISRKQLNTLMRKVVREQKMVHEQSDDSDASDGDVPAFNK